jgi:hypothetical protein
LVAVLVAAGLAAAFFGASSPGWPVWNHADSSSRKMGSSIVSSANRDWLSPEAR